MTIQEHYNRILRDRVELDLQLKTLQDSCPHENCIKTARSDTSNYCKPDDRYWYEFKCTDCGKYWEEDQ